MSNLLQDIIVDGVVGEVHKAYKHKMYRGSVILMYAALDSMAYLNMPNEQTDVTQKDFTNFIDEYLRTKDGDRYPALDLYAARCAMLHTYGTESKISRRDEAKQIFYKLSSTGGHIVNTNNNLYAFELSDLINDLNAAVVKFIEKMENDSELREKAYFRLRKMVRISFYPKNNLDHGNI